MLHRLVRSFRFVADVSDVLCSSRRSLTKPAYPSTLLQMKSRRPRSWFIEICPEVCADPGARLIAEAFTLEPPAAPVVRPDGAEMELHFPYPKLRLYDEHLVAVRVLEIEHFRD